MLVSFSIACLIFLLLLAGGINSFMGFRAFNNGMYERELLHTRLNSVLFFAIVFLSSMLFYLMR